MRQLTGKDPDAGKSWGQEEKGVTEDEMIGCYYRLNGQEFEQTPGDSEGRESWQAAVHGVANSQAWVKDRTATNNLLKAEVHVVTCPHSSVTWDAFNNQCTTTSDLLAALWSSV